MRVLCSPTLMLPANLPHKGKQFNTRPLPAFHTRWVPAAGGCHRRSAQPSPSPVCRFLDALCPLRSTRYSAHSTLCLPTMAVSSLLYPPGTLEGRV